MTAIITRIILRYLSGFLIAAGWLTPEYDLSLDPEIVMLAGLAVGAAAEFAFAFAKKNGWSQVK